MDNKQNENIIIHAPLAEYRDLLGVSDLCKIFDVSKPTLYAQIQNGNFGEPIKIGRAYRVPKIYVLKKYFKYG